jgi:hypothetical protein
MVLVKIIEYVLKAILLVFPFHYFETLKNAKKYFSKLITSFEFVFSEILLIYHLFEFGFFFKTLNVDI